MLARTTGVTVVVVVPLKVFVWAYAPDWSEAFSTSNPSGQTVAASS